jgi:hypothetical protein
MVLLSRSYGRWILLATSVVLATVLFLVSGVFQWSPLNCWYDEVDIQSGRIRHTWLLLYCQVSQREEETWLSKAADSKGKSPEWRRVYTFSPGSRISPHHTYHGAIHQIKVLKSVEDLIPLDPAARRCVANQVICCGKKARISTPRPMSSRSLTPRTRYARAGRRA